MTSAEFLSKWFVKTGLNFVLPKGVLGLAGVDDLWSSYLVQNVLTLTNVTLDAPTLTASGALQLPGAAAALPASVVFQTDAASNVSGAIITVRAVNLNLRTSYACLNLSNKDYETVAFKSVALRLSGDAAVCTVELGFTVPFTQKNGTKDLDFWALCVGGTLPMIQPVMLLFRADLPLAPATFDLNSLDSLKALAPGSDFVKYLPTIISPTGAQLMGLNVDAWLDPTSGTPNVLASLATVRILTNYDVVPGYFQVDYIDVQAYQCDPFNVTDPYAPTLTMAGEFDFGLATQRSPGRALRAVNDPVMVSILVRWNNALAATVGLPVVFYIEVLEQIDLQALLKKFLGLDSLGPLESLIVSGLFVQGNLADHSFEVGVDLVGTLRLLDSIEIDGLTLKMVRDGDGKWGAVVTAEFDLDGVGMFLSVSYLKDWTIQAGLLSASTTIDTQDFLKKFAARFSLPALPVDVQAMTINSLVLTATIGSTDSLEFDFVGTTQLCDHDVDVTVTATVTKKVAPATGYEVTFDGLMTVTASDKTTQTLVITYQDSTFVGVWTADPRAPVTIQEIGSWFGMSLPGSIPSPKLTGLSVLHSAGGVGATMSFSAGGLKFEGALARLSTLPSGTTDKPYMVILQMDPNLTFGHTSFAPSNLPADEDFGIPLVQSVYTNVEIDKNSPTKMTALAVLIPPTSVIVVPAVDLMPGESLAPTLLPSSLMPVPVVHPGASPSERSNDRDTVSAPASMRLRGAAPTFLWIPVNRSIGPVAIGRLGIGYGDGVVALGLDAGFSIAGFSAEFIGLTLSIPFEESGSLSVGLDGLSIGYDDGAIEFSGEFVKTPDGGYGGMATLNAAGFELAVDGLYSHVEGAASLFVFGMLDDPIGGPPWCFVTGMAGALGLNRALNIPSLTDLPSFPLVAAAMAGDNPNANPFSGKTSPSDALGVLETFIPPEYGNKWFGLGLRFSTFGILESFALFTASFGQTTQFAVLGLTAMTLPKGAASPIAYAEVAVEALLDPGQGVLTVNGQLTPQSYVISPDCQLQGGFAFAAWFKDQGAGKASAGEFVFSLGGYHPLFKVPSYYPTPALVTAQWPVNSNLNIDGSFYFALTAGALMAGGRMSAVWEGDGVRAWFTENADFFLGWRPFQYAADFDVSLGVSYTLDLFVTSVTISVSLGVSVTLAGPPLHGEIDVDLYVVSFSISFGDKPNDGDGKDISWTDFKTSLLPSLPSAPAVAAGASDAALGDPNQPTPTDTFCRLRPTVGLVKDLTKNPSVTVPASKRAAATPDWIISAEDFEFTTESVFVSTDLMQNATPVPKNWAGGLEVGPSGIPTDAFASCHTVTLLREGDLSDASSLLIVKPTLQAVPRASWSIAAAQSSSITDLNNNGSTIDGALVGTTLLPNRPVPDQLPSPIVLAMLEVSQDTPTNHFTWSTPTLPTKTFDQSTAQKTFDGITADPLTAFRQRLIATAIANGVNVAPLGSLSELATDDYLLAVPYLCATGGV